MERLTDAAPGQQEKPVVNLLVRCDGRVLRRIGLGVGAHAMGNDPAAAVPLLFPTVSRQHGLIHVASGGLCHYEDLGSRNGSGLRRQGGKPTQVRARQPEPMEQGAILHAGPFEICLVPPPPPDAHEGAPRAALLERLRQLSNPKGQALGRGELRQAVLDWALQQPWPQAASQDRLQKLIDDGLEEILGDGPLAPHIAHPTCLEVLANGPGHLFIDDGSGLRRLPSSFSDGASYSAWVQRLVARAGRRLDLQQPLCEGTLPDGSRLQAVLSPVAGAPAYVAIRRFTCPRPTEEEALASGWMEPEALHLLSRAVAERRNILISGGTSSGKTTLLNFLCSYLPRGERVVTIEDTFELRLPLDDVVRLQGRRANADGAGAVTPRELVQCALRLRPDRIVVGECRGAEVVDMLQAMNTGHPGSMTTIHANSAADALARLEILALTAGLDLPPLALRDWIQRSLDLVVHLARTVHGRRIVTHIASYDAEKTGSRILYERSAPLA